MSEELTFTQEVWPRPIAVSERLPVLGCYADGEWCDSVSDDVLFFVNGCWYCGFWQPGYGWQGEGHKFDNGTEVTHWLPLPPQPE